MRLFYVRILWYDGYTDGSFLQNCFVFGEDITEAIKKINQSFKDIESLTIEEINYMADDILYVPDEPELIRKIREENFY